MSRSGLLLGPDARPSFAFTGLLNSQEDNNLIWEQHHRFQCVNCKCDPILNGCLEQLVCRNPECIYEDAPYDQNDILHVMLVACSLKPYHQEIRRILDERKAPRLRQPYRFRLIPGRPED